QGVTIDKVAQCPGLALEVADKMAEVDIISTLRRFRADPVGGHDEVSTQKELKPVIIEMGVEPASNETGWHGIQHTIDTDGSIARHIDGEQFEVGRSMAGKRLEGAPFFLNEGGATAVVLLDDCMHEGA